MLPLPSFSPLPSTLCTHTYTSRTHAQIYIYMQRWGVEVRRVLVGAHHTHLTEAVLLARRSYMIYEDGRLSPPSRKTHTRTRTLLISPLPSNQLLRCWWWHIWNTCRLKPLKYSCLVCVPVHRRVHHRQRVHVCVCACVCVHPYLFADRCQSALVGVCALAAHRYVTVYLLCSCQHLLSYISTVSCETVQSILHYLSSRESDSDFVNYNFCPHSSHFEHTSPDRCAKNPHRRAYEKQMNLTSVEKQALT